MGKTLRHRLRRCHSLCEGRLNERRRYLMSEQDLELLEGTVSAVIFQNEENGYTILRLDIRGEEVTVLGPMAGMAPGE